MFVNYRCNLALALLPFLFLTSLILDNLVDGELKVRSWKMILEATPWNLARDSKASIQYPNPTPRKQLPQRKCYYWTFAKYHLKFYYFTKFWYHLFVIWQLERLDTHQMCFLDLLSKPVQQHPAFTQRYIWKMDQPTFQYPVIF